MVYRCDISSPCTQVRFASYRSQRPPRLAERPPRSLGAFREGMEGPGRPEFALYTNDFPYTQIRFASDRNIVLLRQKYCVEVKACVYTVYLRSRSDLPW